MLEKITIKEIANMLECTVCYQPLETDTFFQCENGHSECQACFSQLTTCPVCRIQLEFDIKTISNEMMIAITEELRHIEDADGTIYIKNLLVYLKCSICQNSPTTYPSGQCINGHLLCIECVIHNSTCSLCEAKTIKWFHRSLIVQKLLELTPKNCRFAHHGCNVLITNLNYHERRQCIYKEVRCVFAKCSEQISISALLGHLEEFNPNHENLKLPLSSHLEEVPNLNLPSTLEGNMLDLIWNKIDYLKIGNDSFFFVCYADWNRITFFVYYLGLPKETKPFGFKLRLYNEGSNKEIQVIGPVVSVDVRFSYMLRNLSSFKIRYSGVKKFWEQEHIRFSWDVSVFKDELAVCQEQLSIKKPTGEWELFGTCFNAEG